MCSKRELDQRCLTRLNTEFQLSAPRHFSEHPPGVKFSDKGGLQDMDLRMDLN